MTDDQTKQGKFRVVHHPQIPGKGFKVIVDSLEEAIKLTEVFAYYDMFQFVEQIKPDYANTTYIERYVEYEEDGKTHSSWDLVEEYYDDDYTHALANVRSGDFAIEDFAEIRTRLKEMDL